MIDRRTFIGALASGLLAAPLAAEAQQAGKVYRIGYLTSGTSPASAGVTKAFTDGLRDHGWIEGTNIAVEYRWGGMGKTLDAHAAELARLPLDAIVAVNTPAALAMKRTGTALPVVFATVSEPVVTGLVRSLARPGSNFTGLTTINRELMSKRLEVLKQAIPSLARVGYLANPGYAVHQAQLTEMNAAAGSLGLTLHLAEARTPSEFEGAFARMAAAQVGAFIVQQDEIFRDHRLIIAEGDDRLLASPPEKPPKGFLSLSQEWTSHGLTPCPGRQANHPNRRLGVLLSSLRTPNTQREPERNTVRHAKPNSRTVETLVVVILLHCEDSM